jgi:hypothetical protein
MKEYCVDMDVTFSARMYIKADNEETAKKIAMSRMNQDPRYHTRWGAHVNTEITDVFEEKE